MEKINLPTLSTCNSISEDHAIKCVTSAVEWLFDQKPSIPGFVNTKVITKYINKVQISPLAAFMGHHRTPSLPHALLLCPRNSLSISLLDELAIYHSDVRKDNFLIDVTTERICIVDFQHIGVLPKPFQEYGFFSVDFFATAVGRHLGLQWSDMSIRW